MEQVTKCDYPLTLEIENAWLVSSADPTELDHEWLVPKCQFWRLGRRLEEDDE